MQVENFVGRNLHVDFWELLHYNIASVPLSVRNYTNCHAEQEVRLMIVQCMLNSGLMYVYTVVSY